MAIHWLLREVLDERGVTPWQLAKALDVAHPSIYRLAKQRHVTRISADMLDRLCKALNCQPGDLLQYRKR